MALIFRTDTTSPSQPLDDQQPKPRPSRLPPPKRKAPGFRPDNPEMYDLSTSLDIVSKLSDRQAPAPNADQKLKPFSMTSVPAYLKVALAQVHDEIFPEVSYGVIVGECILHSIPELLRHDDLQMLVELRRRMMKDRTINSKARVLLFEWFEKFPVGVGAGDGAGGLKRSNIELAAEPYQAVRHHSQQLGLDSNVLAILCCMNTLSEQECVDSEYAGDMSKTVAGFLQLSRYRRKMAEILVEGVD